jgi:cation diffusion facilitator family transporter
MTGSSSRTVVVAALIANILVTLTKFAAAIFTGSSAMLSEAVHSLVDSGNEALLLYGQHRAALPPDDLHPLGHGRELYFWSFIVALLIFAVGAGVSLYEGILHILAPEPISNPYVNYIVLGAAFLFEGSSWSVAFRNFRKAKGPLGWMEAIEKSKDPPAFIVLLEDSADLIGLAMAFAGTLASVMFDMPILDGIASVGIALLLGAIAVVLARESKGLLIGERADTALMATVLDMVAGTQGVTGAQELFTMHLAPDQIVAAISVDFDDDLNAGNVETLVAALEDRIRSAHSQVTTLLIKPVRGHGGISGRGAQTDTVTAARP